MKLRSRWSSGFFALTPAQSQSAEEELRVGIEAYLNDHCEAAIEQFRKATELDPSHTKSDMNLMYRQKADLECATPSPRAQDLRTTGG